MVISHRGKGTGEKENSIASFEKAIKLGADGIETDLRITADGNVIVYHDRFIKSRGRKTRIAKNNYKDILINADEKLLTLPELFEYIEHKNMPFFLELKSKSPLLVDKVSEEIGRRNLWNQVHVIGFSVMIKTALKMQDKYPQLRVVPFLNLPVLSFVKPPKKSYGVFLGWIDEWKWSQGAFQKMLSSKRLENLKKIYEKNGFRVMAGVINNEKGIRYFKEAGITDIVTDEIELASQIIK